MTCRGAANRLTDLHGGAAIALLLLGGGCAHKPASIADKPQSVEQAPALPTELTSVVPPARASDGTYLTINHGADALKAMWHVRAALNVAAISCRGPQDTGLVTAYNQMLSSEKAPLARANASIEAGFRKSYGAAWQGAHDAYMTRLYNFFAQPFAKPAFCSAAGEIVTQASAVSPAAFADMVPAALASLEAPFVDGYARIDSYHEQLAAWDARRNGNAALIETASAETVKPMAFVSNPVEAPSSAEVVAPSDLTSPMMALVTPIRSRMATHAVALIGTHGRATVPDFGTKPRLHYADMKLLMSWQPSPTDRLTMR